jgi:tyrosyl-tRNA synthetase
VFKAHEAPTDIADVTLMAVPGDDGRFYVPAVLVELDFASSAGEARRLSDGGGVKLDGQALATGEYQVGAERLSGAVVSVGRRRYARIV